MDKKRIWTRDIGLFCWEKEGKQWEKEKKRAVKYRELDYLFHHTCSTTSVFLLELMLFDGSSIFRKASIGDECVTLWTTTTTENNSHACAFFFMGKKKNWEWGDVQSFADMHLGFVSNGAAHFCHGMCVWAVVVFILKRILRCLVRENEENISPFHCYLVYQD